MVLYTWISTNKWICCCYARQCNLEEYPTRLFWHPTTSTASHDAHHPMMGPVSALNIAIPLSCFLSQRSNFLSPHLCQPQWLIWPWQRSKGNLDCTLLQSHPPKSGNSLRKSWRLMMSSMIAHASLAMAKRVRMSPEPCEWGETTSSDTQDTTSCVLILYSPLLPPVKLPHHSLVLCISLCTLCFRTTYILWNKELQLIQLDMYLVTTQTQYWHPRSPHQHWCQHPQTKTRTPIATSKWSTTLVW